MTTTPVILLLAALVKLASSAQISIGIDHDISKPTFGFQGPTSSHITYGDKSGLNLKGTIGDLLGPPIKMVNGFGQILASSHLAKEGQQLNSKSAVLGLDAKLLEAAGLGTNLLKGGFLAGLGGSNLVGAPKGATLDTKQVQQRASQTNGQKIASVIEVPVSVVPMSGFGAGQNAFGGGAKAKEEQALAVKTKGEQLLNEAQLMKQQGRNQILEGASESISTIGNYVQDVGSKASSAIKLLPIILDLPQPSQQQEQTATKTSSGGRQSSGLTGGSFFGGLGSLLAPQDPLNSAVGSGGLWSQQPPQRYAAVLNATNPFANLLMNLAPNLQQLNPVLYPLQNGLSGGPLAQAVQGKQSTNGQTQLYGNGLQALNLFAASQGLGGALGGQQQQHQDLQSTYSLFPGIKVRETISSHPLGQLGQVASKDQQQQQQKQ